MKASDYIPKLYERNFEMQSLVKDYEVELENLKSDIVTSFDNTFVSTANEMGISELEKIFNIVDDGTDSLDFRRERLINRLSTKGKFTEGFLVKKLNEIIGEGNWNYDLNYSAFTLEVYITTPRKELVKRDLRFV